MVKQASVNFEEVWHQSLNVELQTIITVQHWQWQYHPSSSDEQDKESLLCVQVFYRRHMETGAKFDFCDHFVIDLQSYVGH